MQEQLDRIEEKLDRLTDPDSGIYARLAEHKAEDAVKHRTIYIVLALAAAGAAGAPGLAKALLAALG